MTNSLLSIFENPVERVRYTNAWVFVEIFKKVPKIILQNAE